MFDIGFWELAVVGVVALLVFGPERLPGLIRDVGGWLRRFRHMATSVRDEFEREFNKAEELKNLIERETRIAELHKQVDEAGATIPARTRATVMPAATAAESPSGVPPEPDSSAARDGSSK